MRRHFRFLLATACALALVASVAPVVAQEHDHGGTEGADPSGSSNLTLLANVPRATTATQSDLAFKGKLVFAGNYEGFRVIDATDPHHPEVLTFFRCNGAQSDVSVFRNLLFQSVDAPQSSGACDSTTVTASTPGAWEGVRIFDISDPANPVHLTSVATDCGSHTHTLAPDPANKRVFVYVSSYPLGLAALGPNCSRAEDGGGHGFVSIIKVPLKNPTAATVSKYHLDPGTELAVYPLQNTTFSFRACHDISVFTAIDRAAAACLSEAQVWDISDPANPKFLYRYDNPAIQTSKIDLFHSAAFSWDGKLVAFGDESGGGGAARCVDPNDDQGRIWFLDLATGAELASYKVPRSVPGVCTMHNFNFLTHEAGVYILVSSAYTGGTTVVDVNKLIMGHSEADSEIAFRVPEGANTWSSYWYNGYVYTNDILRGVDIMALKGGAKLKKFKFMNPQTQQVLID